MLVYREDRRAAVSAHEVQQLAVLQRAAAGASADDALSVLIAAGEFEAGVTDAACAERDAVDERSDALRALCCAAARQYLDALERRRREPRILEALDAVRSMALPRRVEMRPSEGYAYYALYPETYAASARRMLDELRPTRVCVVGIRSIGTSLSAVVAAAIEPVVSVTSCTVRPRGHPFNRQISVDGSLRERWRSELRLGSCFAIVDEGPGISGSSFAAVARTLRHAGVPADRIVLLPSWDPPAERLRSPHARAVWAEHRRYVSSAAECGVTPEEVFGLAGPGSDWSGGAWRAYVAGPERCWPAVQPQHERWKACLAGERRLLKFAGLGCYGAAAFERAESASATDLAQAPAELRRGFIDLGFLDGLPASLPFSSDEAETVGRYIGLRTTGAVPQDPAHARAVVEMVRTNVRELLGIDIGARVLSRLLDVLEGAPAGNIDGRMLAHEWIRTAGGLRKVDGFEHGADHFFPGPQNPAWDLAAASLELELGPPEMRRMLDAYRRASGDGCAEERMPAYRLAYAAYRGGYASMAMDALAGGPEGARFSRLLARTRERLPHLIPSVL